MYDAKGLTFRTSRLQSKNRANPGNTGIPAGKIMSAQTCKPVYTICALCCKGPKQIGLEKLLEIDDKALKTCSACHSAYFCSRTCQAAAWKLHKKTCTAFKNEGLISCVIMTSPMDCKQVFLKADDPVFDSSTPSPAMWKCDIPLCLQQIEPGFNNQWCTYLMIEPVSGMAPYPWCDLGKVLLCRRDRMPITPEHVHQLGDFICDIVNSFGGEDDSNIHKYRMTKEAFLSFLQEHLLEDCRFNAMGISW